MMNNSSAQLPTPLDEIDRSLRQLCEGAPELCESSLSERIQLAKGCLKNIGELFPAWVEKGCSAKRSGDTAAGRAEDLLTGPMTTMRFLHLVIGTLEDLKKTGKPKLPKEPKVVFGQLRVPVFPSRLLFDSLIFRGLTAETWLDESVTRDDLFCELIPSSPHVELVLGAGNVSSIPVTDALTKIFQEDHVVLLKMNPVNDYLGPILEKILQPLVQKNWLRFIYGGIEQGDHAVHHEAVDSIHITGAAASHDAIVWGRDPDERDERKASQRPLVKKPVTSELGNVTPWLILPGKYSSSQLHAQAESLAASIANNASFNCIATKMIVTWDGWPQREEFLELLQSILDATPPRYAYYPGAAERFARFSGQSSEDYPNGHFPWILRRNVSLEDEPHLFQEESFVCVVGETMLQAESEVEFAERAASFMNDQLVGTLAAGITVALEWEKQYAEEFDQLLRTLRFGTIGLNQWPGIAFGLMSPPWGGFPGATLADVQSGIGLVHNTYLLRKPEKTIVRAPLNLRPKPVWFSTHRCPEAVAQKLCRLYADPSVLRLPRLFASALRG
jgi:hypothetical protein